MDKTLDIALSSTLLAIFSSSADAIRAYSCIMMSVDDGVKDVEGKVQDIRGDVQDVRGDVQLEDVSNKVQGVNDRVQRT